jgi:hypothetical protein
MRKVSSRRGIRVEVKFVMTSLVTARVTCKPNGKNYREKFRVHSRETLECPNDEKF